MGVADPETRYAVTVHGVHIAYQARGEGPYVLVFLHGFASNLEVEMEEPHFAALIDALAAHWRVIQFDKRGSGLSDRENTPDMEMRADDLRAVLDAVGSEAAILVGVAEGGALATFFAATHPERVMALIPLDGWARIAWAPDYPIGMQLEAYQADTDCGGRIPCDLRRPRPSGPLRPGNRRGTGTAWSRNTGRRSHRRDRASGRQRRRPRGFTLVLVSERSRGHQRSWFRTEPEKFFAAPLAHSLGQIRVAMTCEIQERSGFTVFLAHEQQGNERRK